LLEDDVARTSNCAHFFLKKGFPFVSVVSLGNQLRWLLHLIKLLNFFAISSVVDLQQLMHFSPEMDQTLI